jgi:tagatose-6-phosphate ketose/aldose isomerase
MLLLPEEACDEGLAMTGSFSSMLLAGLLVSRIQSNLKNLQDQINLLCDYATAIINGCWKKLRETASIEFDRAVFLGSGPLQGTACESHLKMQELTDGKVICKFDSFLGFRHGPKVVINPRTLVVYLFSNDAHTYQYERDLVADINEGEKGLYQIGISETPLETDQYIDLPIHFSSGNGNLMEEFLAICSIVPVQILSFYKSLDKGLEPDNPSANGTITRIVEGVTIYSSQNVSL